MKLPRLGRRKMPAQATPDDQEILDQLAQLGIRFGAIEREDPRTPPVELSHDWRTFEEMLDVFECAPNEDVWRIVTTWSASPIPGVRWHCEPCREHALTPTFLQVPTHCGRPMKPEAAEWLVHQMDERIAAVSVALLGDQE